MRRVVTLLGRLVLGVLTIGIIFVLGMRAKSPLVLTPVRRFNRAVFNPQQMKSAGTEGAYASVDRPDVIPLQAAAAYFTASDLPSLRLFGVDECLRLRRVEAA